MPKFWGFLHNENSIIDSGFISKMGLEALYTIPVSKYKK